MLSFDVGGTTAKFCLIDGARPRTSRQFEIARAARFIKGSGLPVRIPVIEMIEIGAGGGSIAGVDRLGRLTVGPRSAGSEPGPAAFGRGGEEPTVTDADIVLGYIVPDTFAEGHIGIDGAAAKAALASSVGERLDLDAAGAADGVSRIVDESMASAGRIHAAEAGTDLGQRTMIAFGGNGPLHATRVARSAGVSRVIVPPNPGVGSAVGFLYAPVSFEIVRSRYTLLDNADFEAVNALLRQMEAEARAVVALGAGGAPDLLRRAAFMRYRGQGHEIEVPLPDHDLGAADVGPTVAAFEEAYRCQFSQPVPGMAIEILNWAVAASTAQPAVEPPIETPPLRTRSSDETRPIHCDLSGAVVEAAFLPRADMVPGDRVSGPALIIEPQTTTLVSADFSAHVDGAGNLVLVQDQKGEPR